MATAKKSAAEAAAQADQALENTVVDTEATLGLRRYFTIPGRDPFDEIEWETRDAHIPGKDGAVFEQKGVEFPRFWSQSATNIVAQKYFRGKMDSPEREWSVKQMIGRVVGTIGEWGRKGGYFAKEEEADTFEAELKAILVNQLASFNSPVWFNVGFEQKPQCSACQPYDALISTPEGMVPIGEIVTGDQVGREVYDSRGVTRVLAVKHNGRKPVYRVKLKNGQWIEATADHLVKAVRERRTKPSWLRVDQLEAGMRLHLHPHRAKAPQPALLPALVGVGTDSGLPGREAFESSEGERVLEAEAALAGWLQADGFVGQYERGTNRSLTIEFQVADEDELAWIWHNLSIALPDVHQHVREIKREDGSVSCRRVRLYGEVLRAFVERWELLARGTEMRVPKRLWTASRDEISAYLRSVFEADGYVTARRENGCENGRIGFAVIGERWTEDIQLLLNVLGIYSRRSHKREKRSDRHDLHEVFISIGSERARFAELIGFVSRRKQKKLLESLSLRDLKSCRDLREEEIVSIEPRGIEDVYDIQTESSEYLSNNVCVHNCFILSVDDTMDSILDWIRREGVIFRGGSGAGVNLSRLRASKEQLSKGGQASGPVSFMRGADASAGTIKSGGKCYREGTLVATPRGFQPIERLRIGDEVLTHKGAKAVLDFMPNGRKQCYRILTREGYEVEVTEGHKFAYWNDTEGGFEVKPIEAFSPGDSLYALLEPSLGGTRIPLLPPEIADPANATTTVEMQLPTELDDKLAYVLGLAYGDGELRTTYPYRLRVAFCKDESGNLSLARFRDYCIQLFGEEPLLLNDEEGCQQVGFTRKRLIEFLAANGIAKGKADDLGFPQMLFRAEPDVRAAFIAGVIDADGTYQRRGGWSIGSIDRDFLTNLQRLLLSLGVPSKIKLSRERQGDNWKPLYRLNVVGHTFVERLVDHIALYSAKAQVAYEPSPGADKGWGYRPSLLAPLAARVERRGGYRVIERGIGMSETSGYGATSALGLHRDSAVAEYAHALSACVQLTLESVTPSDVAQTYDIEVDDVHLLSANGIYSSNTRRAAKMVILDVDHPDVEEFIWCKAREERKVRVLEAAGYDMSLDSPDWASIQYQNANNSVRVTDAFMQAAAEDGEWNLTARVDGAVVKTIKARSLLSDIAAAAWECADPGVQYDTTINHWHTVPNSGRINASNPCSEYMSIDNSACNLASLNLMKFRREEDGELDIEAFEHAVDVVFLAQEILVRYSSYPTPEIEHNAHAFRQLGLGYANLGALLMARGLPYDSDEGRSYAAAVTALMTGRAYRKSAEIAARMGSFAEYQKNAGAMLSVISKHRAAVGNIDHENGVPRDLLTACRKAWDEALDFGEAHGFRNAQATVLAPTGCLVGDSLVATGRGLVRLRTLGDPVGPKWQELGVDVATDEGPRQATQFFVNGFEQVVSIETSRGYRIQGTPSHRIKVVNENGDWVWRRFAEIREGDRVPLMCNGLVGEPQTVSLPPLGELYWTADFRTRVPREMTADLAELVGYFMGDGSLHAKGLRFCVAAKDQDVVDRLVGLSAALFGLDARVVEREGYTEVALHSVPLTLWWEACGFAKLPPSAEHSGKGWHPHIPDAILHTNDPEIYSAFVRGLFEADGTTNNGFVSWTTTTEGFSRDVQSLLLALGFVTTRKVDPANSNWGGNDRYVLRLLNVAAAKRYLEEIDFISMRKTVSLWQGDHRQASRHDHIPVGRALVDKLAPENDLLRKTMLMALARRGDVSRRSATVLLERTADPELERLLGFYYDDVTSVETLEDEPTYDISVPDNVTYVANGFISHNTISFMMDCDTTGVEPDFSLAKSKKLVGGGEITIVNKTVPMALEKLGYSPAETAEIEAYIDERNSVVGAPHLKNEHYPVFDCAVGERSIHYLGHVKMMGAIQPFISGAISKTVNMPETAAVDDVAGLYEEAWRLGVKAIAIYREGSKVAQPLSGKGDKAVALAPAPGPVLAVPQRHRLPDERTEIGRKFRVGDYEGYIHVGVYDDGTPGDVFVDIAKEGTALAGLMNSFMIAVSLGLQYGVPLEVFVSKYSHMRFEPSGPTNDPDIRMAKSIVDYIFRWLGKRFLSVDQQEELGILSPAVKARLAQGYAAATTPGQGAELIPAEMPPPGQKALFSSWEDAVECPRCGGRMVRTGSCYTCRDCGTNTGCS